ncbi:hypothetical protein LBMAG35_15440 [Chlorobiota bacterium]|jgi:hypothetical protein|nr:hypothetical protein LBMAG35_15440 [Chlorobiota bacterium]
MNSILVMLSIAILVITNVTNSQVFDSGYFVVPNDAITESVQEQLGNKIKVALSKVGISATDGYFPMVTVVKYDELETIEITGMRKMYKTTGTVTIIITFTNTNTSLAATDYNVEGIGVSKESAQKAAIGNISIPLDKLKEMSEKAKVNYTNSMDAYAQNRLSNARKMKASKDYWSALEIVSEIPKDSKLFPEANKLFSELEKLVEKEAQKEEKLQALREQREYELAKDQLKYENEKEVEKQKTKRLEVESRARVNEKYYEMWTAYYYSR